jgi:hypothetical protein
VVREMATALQGVRKQKEVLPARQVQDWFDRAVPRELMSSRPSSADYEALARELRATFNRHEDRDVDRRRPGAIRGLKDASPGDNVALYLRAVMASADQLLLDLRKLEDHLPSDPDPGWAKLEEALLAIGAYPTEAPTPDLKSKRGRRREDWFACGRAFAVIIQRALRRSGYDKRTRMEDSESPVAAIGACAVNWFFGGA